MPDLASDTERRLLFAYDAAVPPSSRVVRREQDGAVVREHLRFRNPNGQEVPALLTRPADPPAAGRRERTPVFVVGHGGGASKDEPAIQQLHEVWARVGVAVCTIDAPLHGERATGADTFRTLETLAQQPESALDFCVEYVIDHRRLLDVLQQRDDLDPWRLAFCGMSMSTFFGVQFVAIDERIRAAAFLIGGAGFAHLLASRVPEEQRGAAERVAALIDPLHYAGWIAPRPVIQVNGTRDSLVPQPVAMMLHGALQQPKRLLWYDGDHADVPEDHMREVRQFLLDALGP